MRRLQIPISTLYKVNPNLFDGFTIPDGLDKKILINNLMRELDALTIIESDPDYLQYAITIWTSKQIFVWQKLYNTLLLKYDPIANYDRTEERVFREDTIASNKYKADERGNVSNEGTYNNQGSNHIDTNSRHDVYGFNMSDAATAYEDYQTTDGSESFDNSHNDSTDTSHNRSSISRDDSIVHNAYKLRAYGNIGVTTTQQMLESERKTVQFNMFDYIIQDFKKEFCLMIY